jgi:hypothetical protein
MKILPDCLPHKNFSMQNEPIMIKSFVFFMLVFFCGCHSAKKLASTGKNVQIISERTDVSRNYRFSSGIPAYRDSRFDYQRDGKKLFSVHLQEPVVVSVATKPEKWGFFQFPSIMRRTDGSLAIKWHLNIDAIEAYGSHQFGSSVSTDGGRSWQAVEVKENAGDVVLPNGDRINVLTPKPIKTEELQLPRLIGKGKDTYAGSAYDFYKLHDLPESRQGVFMTRLKKGAADWQPEKATLYDPQAARYSFRGLFPVLFWGDIHIAKDQSLIAGIYPGFYIRDDGTVDPKSATFFYRSTDNGHSWKIQGRVLYVPDSQTDSVAGKRMGFTEPAFEIMSDGSFITVARTTDGLGNGPMYQSRSTDLGKTWTTPEIMAPSGVLPQLLRLANGVTVLSSGRPGVQLRFSTDDGNRWSDPFELVPYQSESEQVSCGYTGLIATGEDRFLVVYSDFKFENEAKEIRKAIKVREVVLTRK